MHECGGMLSQCSPSPSQHRFLLEKMEHSEYMRDTLRAFQAKVAKDKKGNEEEESSETDLARIEEEERIVKINTKLGIINYKDRFYNTATMDAKREGHPEIYAELNKWNDELRAELISLGGRCFLAMGTDLFEATQCTLTLSSRRPPSPCMPLQGDYDGRTPIHIAGSDGEVDAAKFLLKAPLAMDSCSTHSLHARIVPRTVSHLCALHHLSLSLTSL